MLFDVWANIFDWWSGFWQQWQTLIRIILIVGAAALLRVILLAVVKRTVSRIVSEATKGVNPNLLSPLANARLIQRAQTLGTVLTNFITWGLVLGAATAVLSELGVAVGAIIAGAGILGAALGFGAQSLVRDLISGLFIVFEDQYGVGDSVDLGQASGVVESVGLRVTQVRDVKGTLWYVRNGEVMRVGNQSQGWSRVVLDIAVPYATNIDKAKSAILSAAASLQKDSKLKASLQSEPQIWGIEAFSGEQIVLRFVQQVHPADSDQIARELRAAIKIELDKAKVKLADTRMPIYAEASGKAVA